MSLHQCMQICVLLVRVILSIGLKTPSRPSGSCYNPGSKLSPGDIVKKPADNDKEYQVHTCLGMGDYGEVWTLNGSQHVLKFETPSNTTNKKFSKECLFGRIAAQKDPAHFVNCFDHGSGEVWTLEGSDLVRKYEWKGGYTVWQKADGHQLLALMSDHRDKGFENVFPDLNSALGHLDQLFHMFDALQKPGTIAPGIGVRQWHRDSNPRNVFVSAGGVTLIDYGAQEQCCDDPRECAVDSGFEDVKIKPCGKFPRAYGPKQFTFEKGSMQMIDFMLQVVLRKQAGTQSEWFKSILNTSLESLVMDLRSSTGPSREVFRNQWRLQNAAVIFAMATMAHKKDVQWPPLFMETVKIALENVTLQPRIAQAVEVEL